MALPKLLQKLFQNNGAGDKLNQNIIPDIPYSKVTDAPSVDSALSSTSENPVQNKVINSALDGKLSTSGGTMTGDIIFSSYLAKIANDQNTGGKVEVGQTGAALLSNQDNYEGGATLLLRSSTYPNYQKGYFFLIAGLSSSQNYMLVGSPNGSLTWGGHNVISVVAESYSANSWYRKYSDGWIEQGGNAHISSQGTSVITLPLAFSNTYYSPVFSKNTDATCWLAAISTTSFSVGTKSSNASAWWYACGK